MQIKGEHKTMDKIRRTLAIWLLRQLGIEELHIKVVVGELSLQDAKIRQHKDLLEKIYGEWRPLPTRDPTEGFVYFVADKQRGVVKIGFSVEPMDRMATLQIGSPNKLEMLAAVKGTIQTERQFHRRFAQHRVNGEWFRLTGDLATFVESIS